MSLGEVRQRMEAVFERAADAVKDALLDWELDGEAGRDPSDLEELPPLDPTTFVAGLMPQLGDILKQLADVVNDAPTERILAANEARARELLCGFCRDALAVGLQMRRDAAEARREPMLRAHGAWAQRWRRMHGTNLANSGRDVSDHDVHLDAAQS
jgi:hypothetical protein